MTRADPHEPRDGLTARPLQRHRRPVAACDVARCTRATVDPDGYEPWGTAAVSVNVWPAMSTPRCPWSRRSRRPASPCRACARLAARRVMPGPPYADLHAVAAVVVAQVRRDVGAVEVGEGHQRGAGRIDRDARPGPVGGDSPRRDELAVRASARGEDAGGCGQDDDRAATVVAGERGVGDVVAADRAEVLRGGPARIGRICRSGGGRQCGDDHGQRGDRSVCHVGPPGARNGQTVGALV